jgi:hypothetical protein
LRDIAHIAARISIASGRRVEIADGVKIVQLHSTTAKLQRAVVPVSEAAHLAPPTPIAGDFVARAANPLLERAMYWWTHSLRVSDTADSLHALFVALDLVASSLTPPVERQKRCKECGFSESIKPGLRDKVIYLLTVQGKLSPELASKIYDARTHLAHGGVAVNEVKKREFRHFASCVRPIVRDEIASRMNCALPPLPKFLPFDLKNSFLIVEVKLD